MKERIERKKTESLPLKAEYPCEGGRLHEKEGRRLDAGG